MLMHVCFYIVCVIRRELLHSMKLVAMATHIVLKQYSRMEVVLQFGTQ